MDVSGFSGPSRRGLQPELDLPTMDQARLRRDDDDDDDLSLRLDEAPSDVSNAIWFFEKK